MNNSKKEVKLFYKRNSQPIDMPEYFNPRDSTEQNANEGDVFTFFGDFYGDESRTNETHAASTTIMYGVQSVSNEETIITAEIDCDFGNGNNLVLRGSIRAKSFQIKNGQVTPYKTERLHFPNVAVVQGTGDFERTTGCAKYTINGHQEGVGSLGELHLMLNKK
jgi:hypothetical protein